MLPGTVKAGEFAFVINEELGGWWGGGLFLVGLEEPMEDIVDGLARVFELGEPLVEGGMLGFLWEKGADPESERLVSGGDEGGLCVRLKLKAFAYALSVDETEVELIGGAAGGGFADTYLHTSISHTCAGFVTSKTDFEGFFGHLKTIMALLREGRASYVTP